MQSHALCNNSLRLADFKQLVCHNNNLCIQLYRMVTSMRFVGLGFYPRDDAMEGSKSTLILSLHDYVEQLMLKQNIHSAYYIYMV